MRNVLIALLVVCSSVAGLLAQGQEPQSKWLRASFEGPLSSIRIYAKGGGLTPGSAHSGVSAPPQLARLAGIALQGSFEERFVLRLGFVDQSHPSWPGVQALFGPYEWRSIVVPAGSVDTYLDRADLTDAGIAGFLTEVGTGPFVEGEAYSAVLDMATGELVSLMQ